jgi:asparagine synthase (glutamine-hydrolysing)
MCGIAGFITCNNFSSLQADLPEAVSRLSNRGPDDSGLYFDSKSGVGLGHRRLSILDLSALGHQPMDSEDGKIQIVYNGEVYNFREIRKTLETHGHHFRSNTDTEVIIKAYIQWGVDCLQRFVGMFALSLWDGRTKQLFMARDRLGIKPLYYYLSSGDLIFASELKSIMAFRGFSKILDIEAIPLFLHYQYVPAPRTIFKNTFKLLPGQYATFDGNNFHQQQYWNLSTEEHRPDRISLREEEAIEKLDFLLTQSVSDRLVSDVPLGTLLSGGIDSSIVTALMQKLNPTPVRTFSIGFDEPDYNEAPWASKIAGYLGTNHTELYVTQTEAMELIPKLPEIYDEPFADQSAIPTYLVSHLARRHVSVALSGDGGDEQFAGYTRYLLTQERYNKLKCLPESLNKNLAALVEKIPYRWIENNNLPWRKILPKTISKGSLFDKRQRLLVLLGSSNIENLYRMTIGTWSKERLSLLIGIGFPECLYEETFRAFDSWPILSRLMQVDLKTYLPDAILTKADRASMAVGLELRVPLLDHRVVEYTSMLSENFKVRGGSSKYLLKKLLSKYVPTELFERRKMGFGVPIGAWLHNKLREIMLDYLAPGRLKKEGLFDQQIVKTLINEHLSNQANHHHRLWTLLMWEMWRERWLD